MKIVRDVGDKAIVCGFTPQMPLVEDWKKFFESVSHHEIAVHRAEVRGNKFTVFKSAKLHTFSNFNVLKFLDIDDED